MRVGNGCTVEIAALSPAIGIEVRGLDLAQDLDEGTFGRLRKAWENHCVALFRDQHLSELDQVNFASRLGPLGRAVNDLDPAKGGAHPAILYVSNVRVDGKPAGILPDGEMFFHSDTCYVECPAMASMLYAIEVPSRGGDTLFANGFATYDALPDGIKTRLTGMRALNVYDYAGNPTLR
jgi:taurine dioxygenase